MQQREDERTVGPTLIDVYLAPTGIAESTAASAVAVRLGAAILLPDDTLNPTRYVLAEPDGRLRAVHVDELETDDGPERRQVRPCTGGDPACALGPGCGPTPERPAAASLWSIMRSEVVPSLLT